MIETMIEAGTPFRIEPGTTRSLLLEAPPRAFLHIIVEQNDVDVIVSVTAEGQRQPLRTVDAPIGAHGEEELTAILPTAGAYRVEVTPLAAPGGRCTLHVAALHTASAADRQRVEADRAQQAGWRLFLEDPRSDAALEHYRRALAARNALGLVRQEVETLDAMAQLYRRRGQPDIAIALLERAIALPHAAGDRSHDRLRLATVLDRAGVIERRDLGRPARAVGRYLERASAIFAAEQATGDLARALHHLGRAYYDIGELAQALDAYDRALRLPPTFASPRFHYLLLRDRAMTLLAFHRGPDAYRDASRAVELAAGTSANARQQRVAAQTVQGRALIQSRDLKAAETVLQTALAAARELAQRGLEADALEALGALAREQNRPSEARIRLEQAQALVADSASVREAIVAIELGYLDVLEHHTERGLERFEQARAVFAARGDRRGEASIHARAAEALRDLGQLDLALERIERAIDLVEGIRAATAREDVRLGFFAFRQEYYDIALDILARQHDAAPSAALAARTLAMHERRLARELRQRLARAAQKSAQADARADGGVGAASAGGKTAGGKTAGPETAIARGNDSGGADEHALSARLAIAVSDAVPDPARIDDLLAALARVRAQPPTASAASVAQRTGSDLERLRTEVLDTGTVALVYALGSPTSLRWVLGANGLHLDRLPRSRQQLETASAALVSALRAGSAESRSSLRQLSEGLANDLLPTDLPAGTQRLVIVADGALHHIPFAALPAATNGGPLIERYEIVMQPSLHALLALRARNDRHPLWPRPIAVIADPVFEADDPRLILRHDRTAAPRPERTGTDKDVGTSTERTPRREDRDLEHIARGLGFDHFARLAHSAREAEALAKLAGAQQVSVATGFDASRATLADLDLRHFGLLHFATHALLDAERPDLSGLMLSRFDAAGNPQPGALYAFEIAGWSLSADLVVLSACDTGRGRDVRGEGVLGLTRRFFDAGATRVVASLWPVGDRQTSTLMTALYRGLFGQGLAPAAALRQAQRAARERPATAGATAWAGFVFQGDWRPLEAKTDHDQESTMRDER